ncbi:low molecular weight phosphatase family protein [Neolewinella agarilytica]|nr:hypothetical protein [Neolewinella agarilytica]
MREQSVKTLRSAILHPAEKDKPLKLNFICTHNSRRSQIAQIWATVAAACYGKDELTAYSGGTEATALHPNVVHALQEIGFRVEQDGDHNPKYSIYFSEQYPPLICWSKVYDDPANLTDSFIAVMVCAEADVGCPFIPSARKRIPLRYKDPKYTDGTPDESATYVRTALEIGAEIFSFFQE